MTRKITHERGAAEMVGVLMLISIIVVVIAVIAVVLFSQPPPDKAPAVNLRITNITNPDDGTSLLKLSHEGGDVLPMDNIQFYVDHNLTTFNGYEEGHVWRTGETFETTVNWLPGQVDIVYNGSQWRGTSGWLVSTLYLGAQTSQSGGTSAIRVGAIADSCGTISYEGESTSGSTPKDFHVPLRDSPVFTITTNSGCTLTDVKVDNVSLGAITSYQFPSVTEAHSILAIFTPPPALPFTINATAGPGGLLSPGNVTVSFGSNQVYTITPNSSYRVANVIVNGTYHLGPVANFTFTNVTTNQTIYASFVPSCTSGLTGNYYTGQTWATLAASNTAGQIHFADTASGYASDVANWPVPYIGQAEDFSVNFTGSLKIRAEDDYTFYLTSDDGSWLNLNGTLIIDNSGVHSPRTYQSTVHLKAGNYPIIVRMFENTGQAVLYLEYSNSSVARTLATDFCRDSPPVAAFNATPLNGNAPLPVQFIDLSTDATFWAWNFGDGTPVSNDQNPVHTYTTAGQYNVTLTAINAFGNSTLTKSQYIIVGYYARGFAGRYYPNANWIEPGYFYVDPRILFADADAVSTYGSPTDRAGWPIPPLAITDYFSVIWDGYLRVPADDTYAFSLRSDDGSCLLIDEATIIENGCSPRTPHSVATVNGSTSLSAGYHHIVVKMFEDTGQAVARLDYKTPSMAAYQPVSDVWYVNSSLQAPVPLFTGTPVTGIMPLPVQFNDSSLNSPTSWLWTFGDGNPTNSTQQNPLHTYATAGTYSVTLNATNTAGSAALTRTSYIVVSPILWSITATNSTGGVIIPNGTISVVQGTNSTFSITPNVGKNIVSVLVDGSSVGIPSSYTFTNVTANHTIVASFTDTTYTINATTGSNGVITPAGLTTMNYGSTPTFNITPNVGYRVSDVLVNGTSVGAVTSYTFPAVTGNKTISATFAISTYTVNATSGANGVVTPAGVTTYNYGSTPIYTITPNVGYRVSDVLVNGTSVGAVTSYSFPAITTNKTISATFAIKTYTITATSGANGAVTPAGVTTVNYGATPTYAITPNLGYRVSDVLVNGTSVGAVTSYTFPSVTTNKTISATFVQKSRVQIYYTDFNAGGWIASYPGWTRSNSAVVQSTTIRNGSSGYSIRTQNNRYFDRTVDTTGYSSIIVQFSWAGAGLEAGDYAQAEYTTDGSTWISMARIDGPKSDTSLTPFISPILPAAAEDNANFGVRFRDYSNQNNDFIYVDDVAVTGIPD